MTLADLWILHYLWLVPVITALVLVVYGRQKKRAMEGLADHELLTRLTGKYQRGRRFLKGLLLLTALSLLLFALAGPRSGSRYQEVSQKGVDIMILVDVSPSMLVEDIKPNRLERARGETMDFLKVVQGDRVGLVAFSGAAVVQCPLTLDYAALQMFLSALQSDLIPVPGTDLGAGIEAGMSSFDFKSETDKVILLITDGEDNENRGLDAARKAAEKGVKIFVLGMGEKSGGPIPAYDGKGAFKKDKDGKLILSRLEEKGLRKIASMTGGTYIRSLAGDLDLDILYSYGIKSMTEARTLKTSKIKVHKERFPFFVLPAILFLLVEGLIRGRKSIKTLILFLGLILATQTQAAESPDELYRKGRFAEAEEAYARLGMDHPEDIRYRYNRGCAAYKDSDYQGAMAAFSRVVKSAEDDEMRFKTTYNLGNTAHKQGDFESAIDYYRKSILYNPASEDARHNLELALWELERQRKHKAGQPKRQRKKDSGQSEKKGEELKTGKGVEGPDKQSRGKGSDREPSQAKDQRGDKSQTGSGREGGSKQGKGDGPDRGQRAQQGLPEDLSGELKPLQALPEEQKVAKRSDHAMSKIDKKKAEALLDSVEEDRSQFLRFQIPEKKRHAVRSGKDW